MDVVLGGEKTVNCFRLFGTSTFLLFFSFRASTIASYFLVRGFISSKFLVLERNVVKLFPYISFAFSLCLKIIFYLQVEGELSTTVIPMHPYTDSNVTMVHHTYFEIVVIPSARLYIPRLTETWTESGVMPSGYRKLKSMFTVI